MISCQINIRVRQLHTPAPSSSSSTQSCFIECEICHIIFKSIHDLGTHRREHHPPIIKKKVHSGTPDGPISSPVSRVNQKPAKSPMLFQGQISCLVCKVGCSDKETPVGHVGEEHPSHRYMCHEANCCKIYISKSGLFKHKKHMSKMHKTTVFCVWTVKKLSKVKRTVTIISVQQVFQNNQRSIKLNHRTMMKVKANVPHVENATQEAAKIKIEK